MTSSFSDRDVLSAHRLRWRRANRWIVDDVSLVLGKGEIVGLLGPNGAGKTVMLERFGLLHVARTRAMRLSGGEQRRLEIARSLASDPQSCSSTNRSPASIH